MTTSSFTRLCEVVAQLRAPAGCPWDREQTNESLVPKLLEEAYEVADAIRVSDDENLREELGDVMLLVVMHAQIASERGQFQIEKVLEDITAKLIRRHPHVFGASEASDAGAVVKLWDSVKREEKKETSGHYLTGVAAALPALMRAQKVQKKAAHVNFDWREEADVIAKIDEELSETKEAIAAGSTLRIDLTDAGGSYIGTSERFWRVYERAGEPCVNCGTKIRRVVQGGRSTYYCPKCQKK